MFPHPSSRLRLALGRGLSLAIEFATLGEYGLPLEDAGAEPPPSAGAPVARPGSAVRSRGASKEVAPQGRTGASGWARPRHRRRPAPEPRPQPCVTAEAAAAGSGQPSG